MIDFVNYEQAKELKNIGFDEICLTIYLRGELRDQYLLINCPWRVNSLINSIDIVTAPLYSQAFRWFREKHKLYSLCDPMLDVWVIEIRELKGDDGNPSIIGYPDLEYNSYEEAQSACLNKLIEIVKNERAKSSTRTINSKI